MSTFLNLAAWYGETEADRVAGGDQPHRANYQLIVRDLSPVPEWLPAHLARLVGPENTHVFDKDGEELAVDMEDDAYFTDCDESVRSSSESGSGASDEGGGALLTVNGPEWGTDGFHDDSSWGPESSAADSDDEL
ncbi:hypothetical protein AURDEDRAFT_143338 [Auricularia subglabra TFB-10046 SS5]|nr:hypothetical protein AURDEDRAFT_143338 [Auricularia subglabra TFB-10046 SS5]